MSEPTTVREICTCPLCAHPMARHGMGYVEVDGQRIMTIVCLDCPRNACLINVQRDPRTIPGVFPCMVCGDLRPDELISVAHREHRSAHPLLRKINVRYCNDRVACTTTALAEGPWRSGG